MLPKSLAIRASVAFAISVAAAAAQPSSAPAKLSAAAIVDKNVAARGGLQAWRAVKTMSLSGRLGAGGNQRASLQVPGLPTASGRNGDLVLPQRRIDEAQLPFVMDLERPRKMRFELQFAGKTAVQVFDGTNGWKLRPYLNRVQVEAYSPDEMKMTSTQAELDGPFVDYVAKGTKIELVGMDNVEGHDTYKLKLTLKTGESFHAWIDAQTFLEAKMEGQPRRLDGTDHPVEVYLRDYRPVDGLQIPFVMETRVLPVAKTALGLKDTPVPPEQITVERVSVNPKFDDALFGKPQIGVASNAH